MVNSCEVYIYTHVTVQPTHSSKVTQSENAVTITVTPALPVDLYDS